MTFYSDHRHGSASWATQLQFKRAGLYRNKGVFVLLCPFTGKYLTIDSDNPLTLIGGAGSGKGTTQLLYNNFYAGSMLINDPKGELGAMMGHYQSKILKKEFYCINPTGLHTQAPWNLKQHRVDPFDILKADSPYLVSDCKRIAAMLISMPSEGKTFFPKRARQWLSNLLLAYALTQVTPTLSGFMQLLNMIEAAHADFKALALGLYTTLGNDDITRTVKEIITKRDSATEEYSGVLSTIYADMDFMSDPQLQVLFSGADFSLDVLSQTNPYAVVDIAFPAENLSIWNKALRLIIGVAILYQYRNRASKPLFIIDEAAQLGNNFEELEKSFTYGRSFYRTLAVFQDLGQIRSKYGIGGIQTFLGSAQAKIFIGIRDLETAEYCSKMLGNQTIEVDNKVYQARARHAQQAAINNLIFNGADPFKTGIELGHWKKELKHRDKIQRPLLTPSEILNMPEDKGLVFISELNIDPILANRMPYFKNRKIAKYFLPNPFHV